MTYKLCYISNQWAYFTTKPLTGEGKQWGDDWNDAPYDCNAEPPYCDKDNPEQIIICAFRSELSTPADFHYNAPYSVEMINAGYVPWLCDYYGNNKDTKIMAGCTYDDFKTIIIAHGGEIYEKVV